MTVYSIYTLSCPFTGRVMYVGKTKDLEKRYVAHLAGGSAVREWIFELKAKRKRPVMNEIEKGSYGEIYGREKFWIEHYRKTEGYLFNTAFNRPKKIYKINRLP